MNDPDEPEDTRPQFYQDFFPLHPDRPAAPPPRPPVNGQGHGYAEAALAYELDTLVATAPGGRNHQLNVSAFNLAQLVAAGHLDEDATRNRLTDCALAIGLTSTETWRTLESAFGAGKDQPRVVIFQDGETYDVPAATVFTPPQGAHEGEPPTLRDQYPAIIWPDLWEEDDDVPWLVEPLIPARRLVALFSPAKAGKSLFMLEVAVELARGGEVLGHHIDAPLRVLYVDLENDPRGDIRTRLQAMHVKPDELGNLVYLSFPNLPYLDTPMGGTVLCALVAEYDCQVVVIDTISRVVGGEENDNDTWLRFYRNTGAQLKGAGVTCVRLDHTGKDMARGMRGGSAKYGDVDLAWQLTPVVDNLMRLDCVAHRLPVDPKVLSMRRVADPRLHHELVPIELTQEEKDAQLVRLLDEAGLGDAGYPKCSTWLKANGHWTSQGNLQAVLKKRDRLRGLVFDNDEQGGFWWQDE